MNGNDLKGHVSCVELDLGSSGTVERLDTRKIRPLNEFFYKLRAYMALFFFIIGRVHVNNTFMENPLLR